MNWRTNNWTDWPSGPARWLMAGVLVAGPWWIASAIAAAQDQEAPAQEESPQAAPVDESEIVARYRAAAEGSERPIDHYNLGTALLEDGQWVEAREPLQRSVSSEREQVRRYGLYNFGVTNALAGRQGDEEPEARRGELLAARQAFRQILRDLPADEDSRWNLELVERWLEEEEQQSGGEGQQGGPAPSQGSGGAQGSPQGGSQGQDRRPLTPEEAAALLEQAGDAESDIRDRMMGRTRYKDPVVEKNW